MAAFLTDEQIETAMTDPNAPDEDMPYDRNTQFVYQQSSANDLIGATNIDSGLQDEVANIQRPGDVNWRENREEWRLRLVRGNELIGIATSLNLINPYPIGTPPSPPAPAGWTYFDSLNGAPTLLDAVATEIDRLRDRHAQSHRDDFDMMLTDPDTGNMFALEDNIYLANTSEFEALKAVQRTNPLRFTFQRTLTSPERPYTSLETYLPTRIIIRLYALHNVLYGSLLIPISADFAVVKASRPHIQGILANIDAGLNVFREAIDDYPDIVQAALDAGTIAQQEELEDLLAVVATDFTFVESLTGGEINAISQQEAYRQYFSTTFNEELITMIPLIQNLYLTEKHFGGVATAMLPPKRATLAVLLNTINNDEEFQMEPDLRRSASTATIKQANGDFDVDAREFILKMLIQTPINILKGLVELIDPHVAITKIIKIGSATAFQEGIEFLNPVAEQINSSLAEEGIQNNITGQRLMEVILCVIEGRFDSLDDAIRNSSPDPSVELPGDLLPTVSLDGIDFTGTIPGMFMIPPSPIGLLYLLLELVTNALGETENVSDGARTEEC